MKKILFTLLTISIAFTSIAQTAKTYDKTVTVIIKDFSEACGEDPGDAVFCLTDEKGVVITERYSCALENGVWQVEPKDLITSEWVINPRYKGKKATLYCMKHPGGAGWLVEKVELDSGAVTSQDSVKTDGAGNEITVIRYPNGNIKSEEAKTDGKFNGVSKYYYSDGKLELELTYENGFRTKRLSYWKNGSKKDEESFKVSNDKYPRSISTGIANHWYESGQLRLTQTFNDDGKIIQHKEYYSSGKIKSESNHDETLAGTQTSYYENGKKKEVITYGAGGKATKMVQYDETGMMTKTVNY